MTVVESPETAVLNGASGVLAMAYVVPGNAGCEVSALDVSFSPAEAAAAAGPCPPWCEIEDHDDYGRMEHSTWTNVEISAYQHDVLMVARQQFLGRAPAIVITLPDYCAHGDKLPIDPDGHISLPYDQALLTFAEAQETAISLLVMSGASTGSPHFTCEPGDPSPCCPDSLLRASAYPAAVFCPDCGSLYWRAEVPAGEPAWAISHQVAPARCPADAGSRVLTAEDGLPVFPEELYGCPPWCTKNTDDRSNHDSADGIPGWPGFGGYRHSAQLRIPYRSNPHGEALSVNLDLETGRDATGPDVSYSLEDDEWVELTLEEAGKLALAVTGLISLANGMKPGECPPWCENGHAANPAEAPYHHASADIPYTSAPSDDHGRSNPLSAYLFTHEGDAPEIELSDGAERLIKLTADEAGMFAASITELVSAARDGRPVSADFAVSRPGRDRLVK